MINASVLDRNSLPHATPAAFQVPTAESKEVHRSTTNTGASTRGPPEHLHPAGTGLQS
jgi:hypothetical protein